MDKTRLKMFIIVLNHFIDKKQKKSTIFQHYEGGGGGGGRQGGREGQSYLIFNESLFSIFNMGPLIDFRLTIQSEKL